MVRGFLLPIRLTTDLQKCRGSKVAVAAAVVVVVEVVRLSNRTAVEELGEVGDEAL